MINDRQFILAKHESSLFEDWNRYQLSSGYYLYCHKDLSVIKIGENIVLLGFAWQVDPTRQSPEQELATLARKSEITHQDIYEIEKTWCGRYILIVNDWLYLDATGMLGLFYSEENLSSSLNVLCTLENRDLVYPDFQHRDSPDFFPGPLSPYQGIRRLMPSQILNYTTLERLSRPLLVDEIPTDKSEAVLIEELAKYFTHSVKNLEKTFSDYKIWFALSGGRDSRATLALFEKAGVDYQSFTLWHKYLTYGDYKLPFKLAKALHKKHHYIKRDESQFSQKRYNDYMVHTAGMAVDADWLFYAYNQYQSIQSVPGEKVVIIRGGIWETPEEYYSVAWGKDANDVRTLFPGILKNEMQYKSMMEWLDTVNSDDLNRNVSYMSRITWEMLQSSWLSSVEQSFDVMDGIVSIQPLNCRLFLRLLLAFNLSDRRSKVYEEKIAATLCPAIANIPFDYQLKKNVWTRIFNKLKKLSNVK